MNRYKSPLVKVEKENENKHIRRKILNPPKETVWERLSKARRTVSNEQTAGSASTLNTKSTHRMNFSARNSAVHPTSINQSTNSNVKPLGVSVKTDVKPLAPNTNLNKRTIDKKTIGRKPKPLPARNAYDNVIVEEIPLYRPVHPVRPVKDIFAARNIRKSSSGENEIKEEPKEKRATSCQTDQTSARALRDKRLNQEISDHTICNLRNYAKRDFSRNVIWDNHCTSAIEGITHAKNERKRCVIGLQYPTDIDRGKHDALEDQSSLQVCDLYSKDLVHSQIYITAYDGSSLIGHPKSPSNDRNRSPTKNLPNKSRPNSNRSRSIHKNYNSRNNSPYNSPRNNHSGNNRSSPTPNNVFNNFSQQRCNMSQDSIELYEIPPLIPVPTRESLNSSPKLEENIKGLLETKKHSLSPSEFKLIKRIIKSDDRYRRLHQMDETLCKDILKTQLQDILKQGLAVKSTLQILDSSESENQIPSTPCIEKSLAYSETLPNAQQVDVIFKNVPSLEKEIVILRALGEKLEATLKRTTSRRTLHICERRSTATSMLTQHEVKNACFLVGVENYAKVHVLPMGIRCCLGVIKEFHIAHKTIVELKAEADKHFYLPLCPDRSELRRTSFKKLKKHPDVLMRYLKPKSALVPFNILEQDPMFFNSFLLNMATMSRPSRQNLPLSSCESPNLCETANEREANPLKPELREGGDCAPNSCASLVPDLSERESKANEAEETIAGNDDVSTGEEINGVIKSASGGSSEETCIDMALLPTTDVQKSMPEEPLTIANLHVTFDEITSNTDNSKDKENINRLVEKIAQQRAKQTRRRPRRTVTPMPLYKYAEPKNNLLKTILVGSLQISVFLLLIMAITYPELKC